MPSLTASHTSPARTPYTGAAAMRTIVDRWTDAIHRFNASLPGSLRGLRALAELERLEAQWDHVAG